MCWKKYRGIFYLSVPGKIFANIILDRMLDGIDMNLSENQCGFSSGCGCVVKIFCVRMLIENVLSSNCQHLVSLHFKSAFESIYRPSM